MAGGMQSRDPPYDLMGGDAHGNLLPSLGKAAAAAEA